MVVMGPRMKHFALRVGLIASWLVLAWVLTGAFASCSRCATYFPADVWLVPWARFWRLSGPEKAYDLGVVTTFLVILVLLYLAYLTVRWLTRRFIASPSSNK
jgi:hypothetical protein